LFIVESADYRIDLELDAILPAPRCNLVQLWHLIAGSSTNLDVGSFVEGVARDSQNIDIGTMLLNEALLDETAIGDY